MRRMPVLLLFTAVLALMGTGPIAAAETGDVTITADAPFGGPGIFTATGDLVCPSGTTSESPVQVTGGNQARALTFHLDKTFICGDGSGSFTLRINAHVQPCDAHDYGGWAVVAGSGAYAGLRGAGTLVGTYYPTDACDAEGIVDVFSGRLTAR